MAYPSGEVIVREAQPRSAVRSLASVPRSVAMRLVGHKTESVYRRYAIADDRDLRVAIEKLDASAVG